MTYNLGVINISDIQGSEKFLMGISPQRGYSRMLAPKFLKLLAGGGYRKKAEI